MPNEDRNGHRAPAVKSGAPPCTNVVETIARRDGQDRAQLAPAALAESSQHPLSSSRTRHRVDEVQSRVDLTLQRFNAYR